MYMICIFYRTGNTRKAQEYLTEEEEEKEEEEEDEKDEEEEG